MYRHKNSAVLCTGEGSSFLLALSWDLRSLGWSRLQDHFWGSRPPTRLATTDVGLYSHLNPPGVPSGGPFGNSHLRILGDTALSLAAIKTGPCHDIFRPSAYLLALLPSSLWPPRALDSAAVVTTCWSSSPPLFTSFIIHKRWLWWTFSCFLAWKRSWPVPILVKKASRGVKVALKLWLIILKSRIKLEKSSFYKTVQKRAN